MPAQTAKTQQVVAVKDVKNGVVVLKSGSLRKVVFVEGINFDLKSEEEQQLIINTYQSFLNSLDFSVQINLHSRKLNAEEYLGNLEKQRDAETNDLLKTQLGEYIEFVKSFVGENAIMAKSFFVVIPYDPVSVPGVGQAKPIIGKIFGGKKPEEAEPTTNIAGEINPTHLEQLELRANQVIDNLRRIGLRAVALNDDELLELYFNSYNPVSVEKRGEVIARQGTDGVAEVENVVAPAALEVNPTYLKIGDKYAKTLFVFGYPRYLSTGWFSPVINLPELVDISIFIHPVDTGIAMRSLRKKSAQIESQVMSAQEKGLVRNPLLETALRDVESLRESLQTAEEKLFKVGVYITVYADSEKELKKLETDITNTLDAKLINLKPANYEQLKGFSSTMPVNIDELKIHTPLNSSPLSSFFPFIALDLTSDEGVMYGVNRHNNTLIIFDRFSLENANTVIFGKAGSGKSYAAKLEVIRSMMFGSEVIVVDPENEYETLARAVGGSYFKISLDSKSTINPFDISVVPADETPAETLKSHIADLTGLVKLMLGKIKPEEEALLDQAITQTFASRDITPESGFEGKTPPLLEDLENVLRSTREGEGMASRLYRFTKGTYSGFANKPTSIDINNRLVVFSVRDLEEEMRPIAMYVILNFIWGLVRAKLKKRIMVVDEAWWMLKNADSAAFLFRLAKRARKYYLGITAITQDAEDFLSSPYGRPIITNSSLQLLLKQSPTAIDLVVKAFGLTDVEKNYLLEADVGQGLFIAGFQQHVAIQVIASYFEHQLITTNPEELVALEEQLKAREE
ncbi:MAG: ATP-binding protein [Candidatus Colwellbacteria bacterium]|nr:ATP-binding protein [Candidatus Colwellbacteria bacterium]